MSDSYPEYLNPFAEDVKPKSKLSLSHSFKELRRTLRQSFRIKKKEEEPVTIRQKTDTFRRLPVSYPAPQRDALPRSRFQERLRCEPSTSTAGPNPFEEDESNKDTRRMSMRRRTKKKAPLPPKSLSSQDINNDNMEDSRGSHWSLTSGDTSYSDSIRDGGGGDLEVSQTVLEKVIDFNKEMEKLKDDTNNNIITSEDQKNDYRSDIPEIEVTSPEETNSDETKIDKEENHLPEDHSEENNRDGTSSTGDSNEALAVNDITNSEIQENGTNTNSDIEKTTADEVSNEEPFLYYEKQSLYIAGSTDELNDSNTYRVSVHITNDDLDACNNNNIVCDDNQSDTNDDPTPIPKQRKNKLTKQALLGV